MAAATAIATTWLSPLQSAETTGRTVTVLPPPQPETHLVPATFLFQNPDGFLGTWSVQGTWLSSVGLLVPSQTGDPKWSVVGTADFDGDKNMDLLFQHADGTLGVWFMNGSEMTRSSLLEPSQPGNGWRVAAVADLDRNGRPDLVFQHTDGSVSVWFMNGIQLAVPALINPSDPPNAEWRVVASADFNQDGEPDLLLQHNKGKLGVWYLSSALPNIASSVVNYSNPQANAAMWSVNGIVTSRELVPTSVDAGWHVAAARDFNGDGHADILFQHESGFMAVWTMKGSILQSSAFCNPAHAGEGWRVVGVTDRFNGIGLSSVPAVSSSGSDLE